MARYGYDAFGRRLWKQTAHLPPAGANDDGPSPSTDAATDPLWQRTDFLWDGDVLLAESGPYAPDAASPDPLAVLYLHEPGSFRPLAQLRRSAGAEQKAQVYHYHLDHLGTPQELTNDNGELVWQAEYRAWGALAKLHVADVDNPLRFQGQYHDPETGLHYNRHRYYAPNEGCFTSQDPIRLAGGSNLAAYAPNPVEWVNPLGLSCKYTFDAKSERYRDASTGRFVSARNLPWPSNRGFDNFQTKKIEKGSILDRYGSPNGGYMGYVKGPKDINENVFSVSERGMAQGTQNMPYTRYSVEEEFSADIGPAAPVPEFGATGGAIQVLPSNRMNVQALLDGGYIKPIP